MTIATVLSIVIVGLGVGLVLLALIWLGREWS